VPHKQAEHMAAPTSRAISVKSLDSKEPSTHGTERPFAAISTNDRCMWWIQMVAEHTGQISLLGA